MTGRQTILPVPRPILRVRLRARSGQTGWFLERRRGAPCSAARQQHPQPPRQPHWLPCRFPSSPARYGESRTGIVTGSAITREAGLHGRPRRRGSRCRDGNITDQIVVTGNVDMNSTGTYLLTYTVQDGGGNTATATRTVTVVGNRTVDLNATVAMDMIWCPPGTFTMGSPTTEAGRQADREDEHNVSLTKGFYLGKYEATQAQYEAVMTGVTGDRNATPSNWHGNPDRPVEKVSWDDAQVFRTRLNEQQAGNLPAGWSYVLPTESQWEYACRAGTTTAYSWGASIASSNANYQVRILTQTRDVGLYAANPWGFFDMHGNVWEWTADWYQWALPTGNPAVDPSWTGLGLDSGHTGWVPGAASGRTCVQLSAAATPR